MIKKILIMMAFSVFVVSAFSQNRNTALLVIDIQDFYFPGGDVPLVNPEDAAENAFTLINSFREKEFPVIFVRHNYEPGGSVNDIVLPLKDEKIITKNEINSFKGTDLDSYLKSLGIKDLVICGMQTHMCVEAATRAAYDLGYTCTVIDDACTSRDLKYGDRIIKAEDVHYSTLSSLGSYAKILTTREYLK